MTAFGVIDDAKNITFGGIFESALEGGKEHETRRGY